VNPTLTVFIPAYNEEQNLLNSVVTLIKKTNELGVATEILIIDDGSRDKTGQIAESLAEQNKSVRVIHHETNKGIGAAFVTAVKHARGDWLILIPADLALEPNELHLYLDAAPRADIVVGLRSDRSDYTLARKIISWVNIHLIQWLFGMELRQFQYISMYRMETLSKMEIEYWKSAFFLAEILIKAKALDQKLIEVEIKYAPRLAGKATGAKFVLVALTVIDLFRFWLRWIWLGPQKASKRTRPEF
jgi:glycosyltransferase involved in cell wall biosynthesis